MKLTITMKVEIDLDDLPKDIRFITVDRDGTICGFSERPYFDDDFSWIPYKDNLDDMAYAVSMLGNVEDTLIDLADVTRDIEVEGAVVRWEEL